MTSAEVIKALMPPFTHIEVRERQNGSWTVHYPDPAFIPCAPVCDLKKNVRGHKCDYVQSFIETNYKPKDYDDAMAWARYLAGDREIKEITFVPLSERRKRAAEESS